LPKWQHLSVHALSFALVPLLRLLVCGGTLFLDFYFAAGNFCPISDKSACAEMNVASARNRALLEFGTPCTG
jgi:hypothetical protein